MDSLEVELIDIGESGGVTPQIQVIRLSVHEKYSVVPATLPNDNGIRLLNPSRCRLLRYNAPHFALRVAT